MTSKIYQLKEDDLFANDNGNNNHQVRVQDPLSLSPGNEFRRSEIIAKHVEVADQMEHRKNHGQRGRFLWL